jgi:catechol 2,3-dioxygenase-like lactoylglutathione lyase family enzyme
MSRIQLALNVANLEDAITFYSTLFQTAPAKVKPGYANFAIANPPLKLVLMETNAAPGSINHLGIEVESTDLVGEASTMLEGAGLPLDHEVETTCCYAVQDKVWVSGPDSTRWEIYTVLSDVDEFSGSDDSCCAPETVTVALGRSDAPTTPRS